MIRFNVIICTTVLLLCGCVNRQNLNNKISIEQIEAAIIGKKIPVIDSLYQDNKGQRNLTLLCSPYDCGPCLGKAFEVLSLVDKRNLLNKQLVISILDVPTEMQRQFNYFDYILFDGDDVIRKSLKYIPTPVFLVADADNVVCMLFPESRG